MSDTGLGIKDEDKGKLFKLFGKLNQSSDSINPSGIGLGLTICNNILMQYESKLELESEEGKGSDFFFIMPIREIPDI